MGLIHVSIQSDEDGLRIMRSAVRKLKEGEQIYLSIWWDDNDMCDLVAILSLTDKIHTLDFAYRGYGDRALIPPLLPNLQVLLLSVPDGQAFDFATLALLQLPKLKELQVPKYLGGDIPGFFAALAGSGVERFEAILTPPLIPHLCAFLPGDRLVELELWFGRYELGEDLVQALAACTRLAKLTLGDCVLPGARLSSLPKCVTWLKLYLCRFEEDFEWPHFQGTLELKFVRNAHARGLDSLQLDRLVWDGRGFEEENPFDFGKLEHLELDDLWLADAARALTTPGNALKTLALTYNPHTAAVIEGPLWAAFTDLNCKLTSLRVSGWVAHKAAAEAIQLRFNNLRAQ